MKLAQQQAEMAAQLPQGHFLDLIAQLVSLNQLPNLLKKLNSNLQKLVKPKAKTPAKKKAKTAAKAKPSVKKKPRSASAEIKKARKHSGD
jgi:predicted transcriptional regulator